MRECRDPAARRMSWQWHNITAVLPEAISVSPLASDAYVFLLIDDGINLPYLVGSDHLRTSGGECRKPAKITKTKKHVNYMNPEEESNFRLFMCVMDIAPTSCAGDLTPTPTKQYFLYM
jgi:hypothetical protein